MMQDIFFSTVPASFLEHVTNQTVLIGNKASILCNALGDNPIKIRWLRNHKFIGRTPSRMKVYNILRWYPKIISFYSNNKLTIELCQVRPIYFFFRYTKRQPITDWHLVWLSEKPGVMTLRYFNAWLRINLETAKKQSNSLFR